jgi:tetratricopeptide (TPR) repeat protein
LEAGLRHFNANKDSNVFEVNEGEMNQIGYQLMGDGKHEAAAQVFKLNIAAFPKSANAYDSYAEALMNLGDNAGAIKNYTTSVEMDPSNQNGIDMLKKLGVDTKDLVKEVVVPDDILASYIGRYELLPGFILQISKEGSQLKAQATGQEMLDIFPKSNSVFYLKVVQAQITFNKGANGAIESLTLFQGGKEMVGKKLAE